MSLSLGANKLPLPSDFMETPSSRIGKGVGVHKRAYAKIRYVGRKDGEYVKGCPGSIKTIESDVQQVHSKVLGTEGSRLTPKPVLESVSMANDGGQDLSDAMLFELTVSQSI